jgi:tyrosinase
MNVELQINNSTNANARFVGWCPSPCRIRVTNSSGATTALPVSVQLRSVSTATGGAVVFRKGTTGAFSDTLNLSVPITGASVPFFVAGKFGRASTSNGDVRIEARALLPPLTNRQLVGSVKVMVRIRKNAESLTTAERDRFVAAFAQLNQAGRFQDFRDMHTQVSQSQAHGAKAFLPWHRSYLLDLEREIQSIDPSVAMPYWRFDQPGPKLFTRDFMGVAGPGGTVEFSATNPLQFWSTDGFPGITRSPRIGLNWDPTTQAGPGVLTEADTFDISDTYPLFREDMELNPHGAAHTRWDGFIRQVPTAAKDPLFFLLHCNVDRLWAKWQRLNGRFDPAQAASYDSAAGNPGHNLPDTMWPWNGVTRPTDPTRPPTAPGGGLASSPCTSAPGGTPRVQQTLDYQGAIGAASRMAFDYDDVRF